MDVSVYIPGEERVYGNYQRAVEAAGGRAVFGEAWRSCDCLLLPGGGDLAPGRYGQENRAARDVDPAREELEARLLSDFLARGRPVLGVCRGMQAINVFFGGDLVQDWPGHSQVRGADRMHAVRIAPGFLRTLYEPTGMVNSAHHQIVDRLGAELEAIQWAPDGAVEALRHKRLPIWGVQWHPERLPEGARLYAAFLDLADR